MGQQQLLLIVLGVIIVGIAVAVGINMFAGGAASANYDAVVSDLNMISSQAQAWWRKPASMGGGDRTSFTGITVAKVGFITPNANGAYSVVEGSISDGPPAVFIVEGVGNEDADGDGTPVTVRMTIYPDSMVFSEINR